MDYHVRSPIRRHGGGAVELVKRTITVYRKLFQNGRCLWLLLSSSEDCFVISAYKENNSAYKEWYILTLYPGKLVFLVIIPLPLKLGIPDIYHLNLNFITLVTSPLSLLKTLKKDQLKKIIGELCRLFIEECLVRENMFMLLGEDVFQ